MASVVHFELCQGAEKKLSWNAQLLPPSLSGCARLGVPCQTCWTPSTEPTWLDRGGADGAMNGRCA